MRFTHKAGEKTVCRLLGRQAALPGPGNRHVIEAEFFVCRARCKLLPLCLAVADQTEENFIAL